MRLWVFALTALVGGSAYAILPLPGLSAPLSERIEETREKVERADRREGVLTDEIQAISVRVVSLEGEMRALAVRQRRVQANLDRKRSELLAVRARLDRAQDRLAALRREVQRAERALATRLVAVYKQDRPDLLTVVLEADGFGDLLERAEFLERVATQDERIVSRLRELRARAERQRNLLARLEDAAERAANAILARRDELAAARGELRSTRTRLARARGERRAVLGRVRRSRAAAEEDLAALEREQARVASSLRSAQQGAGPIKTGSGALIWPVNGTLTSPFGQRWGRLHAGVDIAAAEGTPIRAADSGRVALAGPQGGYGLYTCIQHTASMSTCYAHQSRLGTSSGATVAQGEVMGYVGNTGNSFGAHLHFEVRINGQPVDPLGYL